MEDSQQTSDGAASMGKSKATEPPDPPTPSKKLKFDTKTSLKPVGTRGGWHFGYAENMRVLGNFNEIATRAPNTFRPPNAIPGFRAVFQHLCLVRLLGLSCQVSFGLPCPQAAWRMPVEGPHQPQMCPVMAVEGKQQLQATWPDGMVWDVVGTTSELQVEPAETGNKYLYEGVTKQGDKVVVKVQNHKTKGGYLHM